jgi:hypothetical protein
VADGCPPTPPPPAPIADGYEAFYKDKLWRLLPAMYRAADSDDERRAGPLQEIVNRIGAQAAILRRSVDRLWEDESIESCDDWVIGYIGDLLATNLVASLDARGQRLDVARTIYYRRRKGTVALLEELATDITGWDARVVEMFRRLSRTRHLLDPALGWPAASADPDGERALQRAEGLVGAWTGSPIGGTADLRDRYGASRAHGPFDEYFHTADVRRGRGKTGWYDIPRIGVFLWRLKSFPIDQSTPVADAACPNQLTFDPTGRDVPLFAAARRGLGDSWVTPAEEDLPGPISTGLLEAELGALYAAIDPADPLAVDPRSIAVYRDTGLDYELVDVSRFTADPRALGTGGRDWLLQPERGRLLLGTNVVGVGAANLRMGYHQGFSSTIGAGTYDRRQPGTSPILTPQPAKPLVRGGGATALQQALTGLAPLGTVTVDDSLTYTAVADVPGIRQVTIRGSNRRRPVVRLAGAGQSWTLTAGLPGGGVDCILLALEGLFLSGADLVLAGTFDQVQLSCCTLDPGDVRGGVPQLAADGHPLVPTRLRVAGHVRHLVIDRSILGPIQVVAGGRIEELRVTDSILQATAVEPVLDVPDGEVDLARVTVLGKAAVHRIEASECLLRGVFTVADLQHGCVRFSAWSTGSALPRKYESVEIAPEAQLFTSTVFAQPGYAQLLESADLSIVPVVGDPRPKSITAGAQNGAEMGAFAREKNPIKERSLLIKYQEYMPLGLEPVLVHVT